jgi:hypothetical protein
MTDYSPSLVNEIDVRNFFSPPLDYDDVSKAELLIKIEAVEQYVSTVYGVTGNDGRIASLLLIAAKVIQTPGLANKYYTLSYEKLGDYAYNLAQPISRGTDVQSSPFVISRTWEKMALEILERASSTTRYYFKKVNE